MVISGLGHNGSCWSERRHKSPVYEAITRSSGKRVSSSAYSVLQEPIRKLSFRAKVLFL
jgi:hypothetical protein